MSDARNQTVEVALADADEVAGVLRQQVPAAAVVNVHSDYRDFSIVEVACTAAVTGLLGAVIDVLRDYIKRRLVTPAPTPTPATTEISIRIGQVVVQLDSATSTPAEVDAAFDRLQAAVEDG